jgi:hypothetical protein
MKPALLLLLAALSLRAAPASAVLTDDMYQLPPGEWRWVRFEIRQRPAAVECHFETTAGEVRAELLNRPDLELFRDHRQHDALASTAVLPAGSFSQYIEAPGEYAVVIEDAGRQPVAVHLNVTLTFGVPKPVARYLSPNRRLTVILVSFVMFFAIVTLSTRALLRAMKRH